MLFNVNAHLVILFQWVIPFDTKMAHMMFIVPVDVAIALYAYFVTNISFTSKCLTKLPGGLCFPDEVCLFKIHTSLIANTSFMSCSQTFSHINGRYGCFIQHAIDSLKCVVLEVYHLEYMFIEKVIQCMRCYQQMRILVVKDFTRKDRCRQWEGLTTDDNGYFSEETDVEWQRMRVWIWPHWLNMRCLRRIFVTLLWHIQWFCWYVRL